MTRISALDFEGVIFHCNTLAKTKTELLHLYNWEILDQPRYYPDLAPARFFNLSQNEGTPSGAIFLIRRDYFGYKVNFKRAGKSTYGPALVAEMLGH